VCERTDTCCYRSIDNQFDCRLCSNRIRIWGTPLLEKRQGQADLQNVENNVVQIHDRILEVSNSGSGTTKRVDFSSSSGAELRINEEQDYISITTEAEQSPYPRGSWNLIRGKSLQNLSFGNGDYGIEQDDLPGVLAVRPSSSAGTTVLRYIRSSLETF